MGRWFRVWAPLGVSPIHTQRNRAIPIRNLQTNAHNSHPLVCRASSFSTTRPCGSARAKSAMLIVSSTSPRLVHIRRLTVATRKRTRRWLGSMVFSPIPVGIFPASLPCPLDCENVKTAKQASPLASSCEGDDGVQVFLPEGPRALIGARLTCGSDAIPVLLRPCSVIPLRANLYRPPLQASATRAPQNQGCGPVLPTICGTLRCSTHGSFHGFAEGSSGCQGAGSFATLFVRLWLHYSFSSAKRTRVLLPQYLCNKLTDFAHLPKQK